MYYAEDGTLRAIPFKQQPIGAVKGFPETGRNQWRAKNDDDIVGAINEYHGKHGFLPGDEQFMTPGLMKSWQMQESGSSEHQQSFQRDPFQVNNSWDYPKDRTYRDGTPWNEKTRFAGLRKNQVMTPSTSAAAALEWLLYKGTFSDDIRNGKDASTYRGKRGGLSRSIKAKEKGRSPRTTPTT